MLTQILSFLLDVVVGLLGGACLLRLYMQYQRIPFGNPVGRFVFALSDWIVLPLRKVLPGIKKLDTASLVAAYLLVLAQYFILFILLLDGRMLAVVPIVAFFALLRFAIYGLIGLLIVYAILSWVNSDSPMFDVIDRLCAPMLRPFRRLIPLVGGFDLSPLALLVVLQIGLILLGGLQQELFRLPFS
jgi:YggT family protein